MKIVSLLARAGLICLLFSHGVMAADSTEKKIRDHFHASRPDLGVSSVAKSPVSGLYEVQFKDGPRVYATPDGKYFVLGDLYQVGAGGFVNLAEQGRQAERVALMSALDRNDMIIFSPEGEQKAAIYVFTDVDCGYCQKLHQEVPELNKLGVEVRYLAYPRAGVGSPTYNKMMTAWCSEDRNAALTTLKSRQPLPMKTCNNPIAGQYELGGRVGVTGTPAIVMADGELVPGYMPAAQLAKLAVQHSGK